MTETVVTSKFELERSLHSEREMIRAGKLKEENPLDLSESFQELCKACRTGDLKVCQEKISEGVNINARDPFDYTPLILASLCGQYEVAQLLLDNGALCERDTFQGERCLYNALNEKLRRLFLNYDYTYSTDPLQPYAAHFTSLLARDFPQTSDVIVCENGSSFNCHKFLLSARTPHLNEKLASTPRGGQISFTGDLSEPAFNAVIKHIYFGEAPREVQSSTLAGYSHEKVIDDVKRASRSLELPGLAESIRDQSNRKLARQHRSDELARGREQIENWFRENVVNKKIVLDVKDANAFVMREDNETFADVILRADEPPQDTEDEEFVRTHLYPVHKAILLKSEYFLAMFSLPFRESQSSGTLSIVHADCAPDVLEAVLCYLYTDKADFPLAIAVDVLWTADLMMIERLKNKAAVVISALGNGSMKRDDGKEGGATEPEDEEIDVYNIIHAGWATRVQRLEQFAARYLAYRLESHIDLPEFRDLVIESAERIKGRQETDTIELIDDIRYYLNERFRLRFDDPGFKQMLDGKKSKKEADGENPSEEHVDTEGEEEGEEEHETSSEASTQGSEAGEDDEHSAQFTALDGRKANDEFQRDTMDYEILIDKLDELLDKLDLGA